MLVGRRLQAGRIGHHDLRILKALVHLVNNHLIEHARLGILVIHIDVDIGDAAIKHAFGNLDSRARLLHRHNHSRQLLLGIRRDVILKDKRNTRQQHAENADGHHDAPQRNAGRLHGRQFQLLAHISERNERSQQNGQRQSHRHQRDAGIPEKFGQNLHRQTLADQIIDITPKELHNQHEKTHKKRSHKKQQELFEDIRIYFFDNCHYAICA